jgi:hypothetical protein
MKKISWTDRMRNEEVLLRFKEQRYILHEIHKRKVNWIAHILRRNCRLQRVTEGKIQGGIEVTGTQGRRRRKLLDDHKERRGYSRLKEAVNTFQLGYKNQSLYSVSDTIRCLFSDKYKTHKYSVCRAYDS